MTPNALRACSAFVFVCSVAVLLMAAWLTPDPSGLGTHTQLGLEPCISMSALRLPCPMCGMTTTFSLMADFRPFDALSNQPFGVVLFLLTAMAAIVAGFEIVDPRKRWIAIIRVLEPYKLLILIVLFGLFFVSWLYKIAVVREMFTPIA